MSTQGPGQPGAWMAMSRLSIAVALTLASSSQHLQHALAFSAPPSDAAHIVPLRLDGAGAGARMAALWHGLCAGWISARQRRELSGRRWEVSQR